MTERRRLHITPFKPELLRTILPPPILETATNISYHTLQAFPEKNYGYVELPFMEAEKIKKKLNGSILKGSEMHIEAARPEKASKRNREEEVADGSDMTAKKAKRSKPQRAEGVLMGYELPKDRKIKRGWTEPPSNDSKNPKNRVDKSDKMAKPKKSSFTDKSECLFKTTLPPNATKLQDKSAAGVDKAKKRKRDDSDRVIIVHEFENTTKHASFLRNDQSEAGNKATSKFVDDVGWVDENGNVVEALPQTRTTRPKADKQKTTPGDKIRTSKEGNRKSDDLVGSRTPLIEDDETSSSGISSSDSDSEANIETSSPAASPVPGEDSEGDHNDIDMASGSAGDAKHGALTNQTQSLSITRSPATPPPSSPQTPSNGSSKPEVHPLEALFKRPTLTSSQTPKKPNLEVRTSFSFDPSDQDGENGNTKLLVPQTPFTQQDIRQRRQRSAAPTPDTAAPGKTFNFAFEDAEDGSDEDDVEEGERDTPVAGKQGGELHGAKGEKEESEFSKWFWEHRGETNRAWKKRKREAAKEKRQKDNKERSKRG